MCPSEINNEEKGSGGSGGGISFFKNIFKRSSKREEHVATDNGPVPHEFIWHHGGKDIRLYGNWDGWQQGIVLKPRLQGQGHSTTIMLDPKDTWTFKYMVDGEWRCALDLPTCKDDKGNVNNVLLPPE